MRLLPTVLAAPFILASLGAAWCQPVTASRLSRASDDPEAYLIDGRYLRDEAAIARIRARGDLPDTIPDGTCSFQIAGDPRRRLLRARLSLTSKIAATWP